MRAVSCPALLGGPKEVSSQATSSWGSHCPEMSLGYWTPHRGHRGKTLSQGTGSYWWDIVVGLQGSALIWAVSGMVSSSSLDGSLGFPELLT